MKTTLIIAIAMTLFATSALARPDCESMAKQAALALGAVVNQESTEYIEVTEVDDNSDAQIFDVMFDTKERGASVTYTVTVERNPSPIIRNQWCSRVAIIEITAEE